MAYTCDGLNLEGRIMLAGTITDGAVRCAHPGVRAAIEYAQTHDMAALPCGRNEIDGDNLFVNVAEYTTKLHEDCKFEAHRSYIDVQCVVSGTERVDSTLVGRLDAEPFDEAADFHFLAGDTVDTSVVLKAGDYAVYFPEDAHRPGMCVDEPTDVKKAVFKVLV